MATILSLRDQFASPADDLRPYAYLPLPAPDGTDREAELCRAVADCRRSGCGTLIPQLPSGTELDSVGVARVREMYAVILREAKAAGLCVGFYLDPAYEHTVIHAMSEIGEESLRAMQLDCKEYICARGENLDRKIHRGVLLSIVAFSEETNEIIDLRDCVSEGRVRFTVPEGNYLLREYLAVTDTERECVNYLSFDASYNYICAVFALFGDTFTPYLGSTLSLLCYSGIGFNGRNRRSWDPSFNKLFSDRFGIDPAPLYPALFGYVGKETEHYKAMLMTVRASLLQHGILCALKSFAEKHGLSPFGNLSEPKLTACSWLMGDAMLNNIYSPCALFDKAYMYGTNSAKIAAGAAYNFDNERVNAELFRHYRRDDSDRLYKDAMNAFARGVNCAGVHLTEELAADSRFGDFTARVQTLLRGGRHVADIAMLYPIYHLHSKVNLYFYPKEEGYEYPETPFTADYMTLINSISIYAGHDLTLLHPETVNKRCHTEGGWLYLDNDRNREKFRVLVLPSADMISLYNLRLIRKFYDEGGKLIATGVLPTKAFEYDPEGKNDAEVCRLMEEIFGHEACDKRVMRDYCHNENAAGGEAIYLYFNSSGTDGTMMTKSSTVNEALNSFAVPFDVYLPAMPRLECTGALNSAFPEFHTIGLHRSFPGGGMMNHVHKRRGDTDIYYFTNTTAMEYNHHVLLRGAFTVEEWNPYTGEITPRKSKFFSYRGAIYTNLRLTLPSAASTFFLARETEVGDAPVTEFTSIDRLRSEHAALMSEF